MTAARSLENEFALLGVDQERKTQAIARCTQTEADLWVALQLGQAISQEIALERVMEAIMRSLLVHTGSRYGVLLLMHGDAPLVEAIASASAAAVDVCVHQSAPQAQDLPLSILDTVIRTHQPVILEDASAGAPPQFETCLNEHPARSILCTPLLKQSELIGVLYLEDALAPAVYSRASVATLKLLSPQLAISLSTARFCHQLQQENARRRENELALQAARDQLLKASQLTVMGGLAGSIAHEINQPLLGIFNSAAASLRWLNRPSPRLDEVVANLKDIKEAARRMEEIVRAVRALAKQLPATLQNVSVDQVIEEVLRLTSPELTDSHVRVQLSLDARDARFSGDPVQLQQLVVNLVTNAVHAMRDVPKNTRRLRIFSEVREGFVLVGVRDSGSGIPVGLIDRIFDPFYTTRTEGMGLGLAISRSIAEQHGGSLTVACTGPGGSELRFRIPLLSTKP